MAWLEHGDESLVEGVVAKDCRLHWRAGKRVHIKVKRRHSIDAVVIGVSGAHTAVLGLFDKDGEMRVLGTCHVQARLMAVGSGSPHALCVGGMTRAPRSARKTSCPEWRRRPRERESAGPQKSSIKTPPGGVRFEPVGPAQS